MKVLVVTPTYNERESLPEFVRRLVAAQPAADLLIVDDASPDGTGALADRYAAETGSERTGRVHVLHRPGKLGLGSAYRQGFRWGLDRDYDVLVEMDADCSHAPEQLHRLLDRIADQREPAHLVIGSRWISGGRVHNWPRRRELLSRGANLYTQAALGLPVHDSTAGFRAYRREVLAALDLASITSQGYCFQVEMALRVHQLGYQVAEVPIDFTERTAGESKMSRRIIGEALTQVTAWGVRIRAGQVRGSFARRGHR